MTDELTAEQPFGVVRYLTIFSGVTAARGVLPRVRPAPAPPPCASRLPGRRRRPPGSAGTRRNGRRACQPPDIGLDRAAFVRSCAPNLARRYRVGPWVPGGRRGRLTGRLTRDSARDPLGSAPDRADPRRIRGLRGRHRSRLTRVHGRRGWVEQVKVPHHRATLRNAARRATRRP